MTHPVHTTPWLGLVIGNSRLHWGLFVGEVLKVAWNTPHFDVIAIAQWPQSFTTRTDFPDLLAYLGRVDWPRPIPLRIASVIPHQTKLWQQHYPSVQLITLEHVRIERLYPTLGIDRAIALWGLMQTSPGASLVIDAGTAMTFTGANAYGQFVGGAILPGLQLQLNSLSLGTAALPRLTSPQQLPQRWATSTSDSIYSGVFYGLLATVTTFVKDWQMQFPKGAIALTGGDAHLLYHHLRQQSPTIAEVIQVEPNLGLLGLRSL
jgi:type III pantothenate kinase